MIDHDTRIDQADNSDYILTCLVCGDTYNAGWFWNESRIVRFAEDHDATGISIRKLIARTA